MNELVPAPTPPGLLLDYDDDRPEWAQYEWPRNLYVNSVPANAIVGAESGGAKVIVAGDVESGARVYCGGGGATMTIFGYVEENVILFCEGGGAAVVVHGKIHPSAKIICRGGRASVVALWPTPEGQMDAIGGSARVFSR